MNAYTVTQPSDLIGLVPHILGYTPTDSLVLVTGTRHGDRGEVGLTVRFDFVFSEAAHLDADDLTAIVATVLVGADPASQLYVGMKHRESEAIGMNSISSERIRSAIRKLVIAGVMAPASSLEISSSAPRMSSIASSESSIFSTSRESSPPFWRSTRLVT